MRSRARAPLATALLAIVAGIAAEAPATAAPRTSSRAAPTPAPLKVTLPAAPDSFRFLVFGDSGTGERSQYELGDAMLEAHRQLPFELALMLGDNLYGGSSPGDYDEKFGKPYQALLDAGVKFRAVLGNHDDPNERYYKPFNMGSDKYYTFKAPQQSVRFFALDTNYLDPTELTWLENELKSSKEDWKICYFHHPLYSSGKRHGGDKGLRAELEPLFVKYGVNLVLTGHEHFYERLKPQQGVYYFSTGAGGKLGGGINATNLTAKFYEGAQSFILFEIVGDDLHFQTIALGNKTVETGVIHRESATVEAPAQAKTGPSGGK